MGTEHMAPEMIARKFIKLIPLKFKQSRNRLNIKANENEEQLGWNKGRKKDIAREMTRIVQHAAGVHLSGRGENFAFLSYAQRSR